METGPAINSTDARQGENGEVKSDVGWGLDCSEAGPSRDLGRAFMDAEDNLKFYPPLYRQRYETVRDILIDEKWSPPISKVVEFGCAELAMFPYFKQASSIEKVIMVDIDSDILDYYGCRAAPLTCDYLSPRKCPLHVEVLCGSVADCDARLLGANAVVCIELIEHLEQDVVEGLEKTIFGFIEPDIAIFTTPNSDFNVLLKGMQGKFRHYDHKFEWSRSEFTEWTNSITSRYPHYRVEISGVGVPPEGAEDVGHCSQLAMFIRSNDYVPELTKKAEEVYNISRIYDHPAKEPDLRSDGEKLQEEIFFRLNRMGFMDCYHQEEDYDNALIPLMDLTKAVQISIPTANMESIRSLLPPEDVIEKDGDVFVTFNLGDTRSNSSLDSDEGNNVVGYESVPESSLIEERWEEDTPPVFAGPRCLSEYHIFLASIDNATNLEIIHGRRFGMLQNEGTFAEHDPNDDDNDDDEYNSDEDYREGSQDCERRWNSSMPPRCSLAHNHDKYSSSNAEVKGNTSHSPSGTCSRDEFASGSACATSSPVYTPYEQENIILNSKREPITDSGVDLSPLLNVSYPQDEMGDVFPGLKWEVGTGIHSKSKELPKSTSVEVLHLDGSCTLKRRAGLEYVEFAPSTSVALCYTGQTYCHSDKLPANCNMSLSSERKSLDGSLVRDVVDSCSFDFAGDSGYPNSSSLHHDVDVDLTPEQVDDISSENDERSNQSLSEDELSDSSDRGPALPRRVIHPRHPVVPIVFENVENGDLANNNRDGEGNNAVAPQGDEREFVALVQEGEMQPLLAAPIVDDDVLPNNADPFPDWLMDLLRIEDGDHLPVAKLADELEYDEGLGEDTM